MIRNKYHNKKYKILGKTFDSKAEGEFYLFLLAEKTAGRVNTISLQPRVELQPTFYDDEGNCIRSIVYVPDFLVEYMDGRREYIDVKGVGTPDGEIKRKLYIYMNPGGIPLRWLSKGDKYGYPGWVDYFKLKKMVAAKKRG